jgi:tetratricopeptide (TPR) repeat protein
MAIFEEIGHERGVAIARDGLAEVAFSEGDYTGAQALYERSLAQHMARGDLHSAAIARHNLNDIARAQGSYGVAAAGARENLALFRELGNDHGVAASLHILGAVAYAQGHWEDAREYHAEALLLAQRGGNRLSVVSGLVGLMVLAGARGEWNRVARLCGAIEAARLALQSTLAPADFKNYQQTIASAQAALGDQRWQAEWDYGQKLSLDDAIAL